MTTTQITTTAHTTFDNGYDMAGTIGDGSVGEWKLEVIADDSATLDVTVSACSVDELDAAIAAMVELRAKMVAAAAVVGH